MFHEILRQSWEALRRGLLRKRLFSGRPAVGETVHILGVRLTVIGAMDRKLQLSKLGSSSSARP